MFAWEGFSAGAVSTPTLTSTSVNSAQVTSTQVTSTQVTSTQVDAEQVNSEEVFVDKRLKLTPQTVPPAFASGYTGADEGSVIASDARNLAYYTGSAWDRNMTQMVTTTAFTTGSPTTGSSDVVAIANIFSDRDSQSDSPLFFTGGSNPSCFTNAFSQLISDRAATAPVRVRVQARMDFSNNTGGTVFARFYIGMGEINVATAQVVSGDAADNMLYDIGGFGFFDVGVQNGQINSLAMVAEIALTRPLSNPANIYGLVWRRAAAGFTGEANLEYTGFRGHSFSVKLMN
jgi:hypothetical protein